MTANRTDIHATDRGPIVVVRNPAAIELIDGLRQAGVNVVVWDAFTEPDWPTWRIWDAVDCNWWPVDGDATEPDLADAYDMLEPWDEVGVAS